MHRCVIAACVLAVANLANAAAAEPIEPGPEAYEGTATNIILFLGDGLGVSTVTAARFLAGGAEAELTLDRLPFTALSRTYSRSHQVTDSAAGMNSPVTGEKTPNGAIAMTADGTALRTILEMAESAGKSTGIVTTTTVTHATPAACYAHVDARNKEAEIAVQLVPAGAGYNAALGDGLEVILGGGRRYFIPRGVQDAEGDAGVRTDGRDLRAELQVAGYAYVSNQEELTTLDLSKTQKLLGLFDSSHMHFAMQEAANPTGEPSLSDMTAAAIAILEQNPNGFFLMVEGGRIDHGHHGNSAHAALTETLAFDHALATAIDMVDLNETLILVTADHSHVMTMAGNPKRGTSILGLAGKDAGGVPYTTLGYANGPGYRGPRPRSAPAEDTFPGILGTPAPKDPTAPTYIQEAAIPRQSETHGGEDVIIWAVGRRAGQVRGVVENTRIFHWLRTAADL